METDIPVNAGENGNSTWLPDIMSSISTQQEETTFWDEVGTDWRTGVYILAGISVYVLLIAILVWYCLGRRSESNFCDSLCSVECCGGDCTCLQRLDCACQLPSCTDCCPKAPTCDVFSIFDDCCDCTTETTNEECCAFLPECDCSCLDVNEEQIVQNKLQNDPNYFINFIKNNPELQRSLREQNVLSAVQQNPQVSQAAQQVIRNQPGGSIPPNFSFTNSAFTASSSRGQNTSQA